MEQDLITTANGIRQWIVQSRSGRFEVQGASRRGGLHTGRIGSVRPLLIQHRLLPFLDGRKHAQQNNHNDFV